MEHESPVALYRPAHVDRCGRDFLAAGFNIHVFEDFRQAHIHRAVDDDTQCTVFVMLANKRGGVMKIRIIKCRHGNEEMITERICNAHTGSISQAPVAFKSLYGHSPCMAPASDCGVDW